MSKCICIKSNGDRCKNKVSTDDSKYCNIHKSKGKSPCKNEMNEMNGINENIQLSEEEAKELLFEGVSENNFNKVKKGLSILKNPNIIDDIGDAPLHLYLTSKHKNIEIIKYLIEFGADVNILNEDGDTPLHYASMEGHLEIVKYLIESGADVNILDKERDTPLHYASDNGNLDTVKYLIQHGAKINIQNEYDETPLHKASDNQHLKIVKFLLKNNANINIQNNFGDTPLHIASDKDNLKLVKILIENSGDINVNIKNRYGYTPLHKATSRENLKIIKYLIDSGADVNIPDKDGWTPSHKPFRMSSLYNNLSVLKLLIDSGANLYIRNNDEETPLSYLKGENKEIILGYIVHRLFRIIFELSKKLQKIIKTQSFGVTPIVEIITNLLKEYDIKLLKNYFSVYIFPEIKSIQEPLKQKYMNDFEKIMKENEEYNTTHIIDIIANIATSNEYSNISEIPDFKESIVNYLTKKLNL